jgi:hypothetical protein
MSTPREMQAGVPQGSVLAPLQYNLDINDIPRTPGVHVALFVDDTCIYTTDRNENYVIRKLQRGLNTIEKWCEQWNIEINEDKTRAVYFSTRLRRDEVCLTLKGQIIEFVNNVKYLGVTSDKRMTWKAHIDWSVTKALQTLGQIYPLLKTEKLVTKTKLTLYKALIRSKLSYACPTWESAADSHLIKLQTLQNRGLRIIGCLPRRTPIRLMQTEFQIPYVYDVITKICRKQAAVILSHDNEIVRNIGSGEAQHRKHKRLKT